MGLDLVEKSREISHTEMLHKLRLKSVTSRTFLYVSQLIGKWGCHM